jgi:hypothetical protein
MAVSASKLLKLDKENAKTPDGEHLWVTVVLETGDEVQGYYRHDAVGDTVAVKVPGRRGRLKNYNLQTDVNDIEMTETPKQHKPAERILATTSVPSRQGTRKVTSIPDDDGKLELVGAAAKKLAAPAGVMCYITGEPTDSRHDVALMFQGTKYFITAKAFFPVLVALGLVEEKAQVAAEAPAARKTGRPAGSRNKATVTRRR